MCSYSYFLNCCPKWVRNIEIFMDNAGKTNKNMQVFSFLHHMASTGRFDVVVVSFMIAGHTKVNIFILKLE